jgi:glucokinase
MPNFAIGVDLGGTNLRISAIEESGRLMETITTGTEVKRGRDFVIDEMCRAIQTLSAKFAASGTLIGVGIGVPGIIDADSGMLRESPNLPGWHDYPVQKEIEKRLQKPVILENDANAAALGEKWLGAARDVDSMCMLTLGTGVGGGLVFDGKIWRGQNGMGGELGHTAAVYPNGHPCKCGSNGCVEQYASATAIKRLAMEAIASGEAKELAGAMNSNTEFSAKLVYQLAIQGDKSAQAIFVTVGEALGVVLANLINGLNLPMYVIGGGVSHSWDAFATPMIETIKKRSFVYRNTIGDEVTHAKRTIVTKAVLGGEAGLLGAARLPILAAKR